MIEIHGPEDSERDPKRALGGTRAGERAGEQEGACAEPAEGAEPAVAAGCVGAAGCVEPVDPADHAGASEPAGLADRPEGSCGRSYSSADLAALLPVPAADTHKYARGKLTIVGGAAAYPGAACLAAAASQRMGAGYTEVVCASESVPIVRSFRPSLVVRSWEGLDSASFAPSRPGRPVAYAVGSGLDSADVAVDPKRLVYRALKHAHAPLLVDGGGLAPLASDKGRRLLRRRFLNGWPTVVTPHAGEAARLAAPFGFPTDDPERLARLLSLAYGAIAVVKGPDTFVSDGEDTVCVSEGTSALAKAGTGDVLAGALGALLAQGLRPFDAAVLAVTLHARAGRVAADRLGSISVIAEDVVEALPLAIRSLQEPPAC